MGRRLPCGSALFASLWRAIQSQSGRLPFLADGFLPLVYLQRFTASAHTRPAEASAGPLADTSRPICPGLGRRAGLPARRPRLAALERWRAGFSFSRPRRRRRIIRDSRWFQGVGRVDWLARLRALRSACERSEPLIKVLGFGLSICPGGRGARPGASAPGLNHPVSAANHLLRRLQPARGYAGRGAPLAARRSRQGACPLRGGAAFGGRCVFHSERPSNYRLKIKVKTKGITYRFRGGLIRHDQGV